MVSALGPAGLVGVGGQARGARHPLPSLEASGRTTDLLGVATWATPGPSVVALVCHSQEHPGVHSADSGFSFQRIPCEIIQ